MTPAEAANLPRFDGRRGFYEVYFLELEDSAKSTGLWLRYTLRSPKDPSEPAVAEVWAIVFDRQDPSRSFGLKDATPLGSAHLAKDRFQFQLRGAEIHHYGCRGAIEKNGRSVRWDLSWSEDKLVQQFPYASMYSSPFPKTKVLSPHAELMPSGRIWVDGHERAVGGSRGVQSHLWGTNLARRWIWCHVPGFQEDPSARLESLTADVAVGPLKLPPLTMHMLCYQGEELRFNSPRDLASRNESRTDSKLHKDAYYPVARWTVGGGNERLRFHGEVWAEPEHYLGVEYIDPDGSRRYVSHSKLGSARIEILLPDGHGGWRVGQTLHADGQVAIEFLGSEPDPRVPIRV